MKYTSLTEDEFIKIFHTWLRPEKPTVLLCRNVMDIMRLRIYFHKKYQIKSFFNVNFLTMDQWIKKILPFQKSAGKIIHTKLAEKAIIFQKLDEFKKQHKTQTPDLTSALFLNDLLKLPAFKNEILYLWHLYSWNRQIQPHELGFEKENSLSSEIFSFFNNVYETMKKNSLITLPELYTSTPVSNDGHHKKTNGTPYSEFLNIQQVFCLFPTDYNVIETIKMNFLIRNNACQWKFIFHHDADQHNFVHNDTIKSLTLYDDSEIYLIKNQKNEKPAYDEWLITNQNFFSTDYKNHKNREIKIRMCKNTHDEFEFIARSIRTLYDRGIALHSIFVLYCTAKELPLFEYYLKKQGLGLNHPEKYSAATRSIISMVSDLIDLLSLKSKHGQLSRNQFIEWILNPVFYVPTLCDTIESREKITQFIFESYDLVTPISLDSLQHLTHPSKDHERILKLIKGFTNDRKKLFVKNIPSQHSLLFFKILKMYLSQAQIPEELFNAQLDAIHKITNAFFILDKYFPEGMEPDFYYSLLYDEISELKLKSTSLVREELPMVYARNIQEGVHSPVDYLFICNLTSKAFPAQARHPDFIETSDDEIKFALNLNATEQKRKIQDSLLMVQRGYCMTFNLQQDSAPSELIFEQIPTEPGKVVKKEKLLADLPFYERTTKAEEINRYPEKSILNLSASSTDLRQSFLSKFTFNNDKNHEQLYQNYTGLTKPVNNEKVSSSGNVENFAWCPQLFQFEKIQKLSIPINYYEERFLEKRLTGTLFHVSAKNLVNHFIQNFSKNSYSKINKCLNQHDLNILLRESFKTAEQALLDNYKTDFIIFSKSVLNTSFEQFEDYFKKFLYLAEKQKHPLYNFYPLAVEFDFNNIALGPFNFKGRMDRIDYCPDNQSACVLDYKTGKSKNESWSIDDIKNLGKFQLPLYIKALCDLIKQNEEIWNVPVTNIQAAYEFTAVSKKLKTTFFMEIKEEQTVYPVHEISGELELLLKNGLDTLEEVLASGYFFAFGHKKSPEDKWEPKCDYCNYSAICDRAPYSTMIKRLHADPIGKKYLNTFYPEK